MSDPIAVTITGSLERIDRAAVDRHMNARGEIDMGQTLEFCLHDVRIVLDLGIVGTIEGVLKSCTIRGDPAGAIIFSPPAESLS